ncbi:T9SS C-terminal target domain-containing protein [candidate division KSB1 bacterium]|nr:T9SS C-terminal target domain-containing protein [candidate division KSB1 bacterium]MCE7942968.1 T9SS C-terminal target domain-containing protein [Chlorobi bacterium CHB1]MDL1878059.1 DNRLRE domain-containing protein [Cytophagia bacterium CHB2]
MRSRNRFLALFLSATGFIFISSLHAQIEVKITASKDNTLYENASGSFSNGSGAYFFAGQNNHGEVRRGLVAFDVAGNIPAGALIQSATLRLNLSRALSGVYSVALHRVLADWGEGTSVAFGEEGGGGTATTGDATWIHTFFNTQLWTNAGGDFAAAASAAQTIAGDLGFYDWGSTPEMVADVQAWLDTPGENFGWLLLGNEATNASAKRFDSREHSVVENRPVLTIVYTTATSVLDQTDAVPEKFELAQNFPNPFNPSTTIQYALPENASIVLQIYDLHGRLMRTLVNQNQRAGFYTVAWDGKTDEGRAAVSGIYFCRMAAGDFVKSQKMALLE